MSAARGIMTQMLQDRRFCVIFAFWHGVCILHCNTIRGFCMKYIIAVIKPHKLDPVREALTALGVSGMTVTEVKGFGRQKGQTEIYRGAEYATNMVPKVKIEVACASDQAPAVIEAIQHAAETGAIGDGKIFEFDLAGALRIRTGDTNETAL